MVPHLSLVVTNIVVNGTCIINLDYITVFFKVHLFYDPKRSEQYLLFTLWSEAAWQLIEGNNPYKQIVV